MLTTSATTMGGLTPSLDNIMFVPTPHGVGHMMSPGGHGATRASGPDAGRRRRHTARRRTMTQQKHATAIDPVCGMDVDPATAEHTSQHDGTTYYFCAPGCKRAFDADPERYLHGGATSHDHHHGHHH